MTPAEQLAAIQARIDRYDGGDGAAGDPGYTVEDIQRILDGQEPSA